ncbi:UDP-glucose dehydrogenase family protein [Priestia abyssalis]|uniref:UDP-glucose dehydrogenase family protein n=1 Tax=Priestia abyssalis TaxID=1221450 RepID=UPI0009957251|nr:UDP-glucose/GDP-mannose dehydrogenase family protein [Priestia abyssalis]
MNVCIIGAGYVGLTTAAVLANLGHTVCCVDKNAKHIQTLQQGKVPIYEPGLKELFETNRERLTFKTSLEEMMEKASVLLIAVGTPSLPDGKTDLTYVRSVVEEIADNLSSYKTIITKSTVPPGTNEWIHSMFIKKGIPSHLFDVVSNPEFLKEGTAIYDMENPDKIVVGMRNDDKKSLSIMKELYKGLDAPYIVTSLSGAEMIKYTSNAFLATKISFINEIARICDKYGVNIKDVVKGISTDPRIGPHFLQSGIGYGGSCFPKDVRSLEHSALAKHVTPLILQAVQAVNTTQVDLYIEKLHSAFEQLNGRIITVLGIAFKPNTDDTRSSPAVHLIERLHELGCNVHTYDPKATLPISLKANVTQHPTLEESIIDSDCLVIATDWPEFVHLDLAKVKKLMKGTIILDARNCLNPQMVQQHGLQYIGVAQP